MNRALFAAVLALAACGPKPADAPKAPEVAAAPTAAPAPPNAATLKAEVVKADADADNAANVAEVVHLDRSDAKLYALVGGDPAINGTYVVLALYARPDGWTTYRIGDFNTWEIVSQGPDKVVLKVSHSAVDDRSGEIVTYDQKIAVALPPEPAEGDAPPASVQVTPVE